MRILRSRDHIKIFLVLVGFWSDKIVLERVSLVTRAPLRLFGQKRPAWEGADSDSYLTREPVEAVRGRPNALSDYSLKSFLKITSQVKVVSKVKIVTSCPAGYRDGSNNSCEPNITIPL